jgi:phenylpropionate dioxygenase-like ring-hydroxylating dioxygenase large terminal subunit
MENSVDYYHVPFIHQETLELPPVIKNVASGPHFMLTTDTPEAHFTRYFDFLYPNVYFHISPSKILMMRVTPTTAATCHVDICFYQTPAQAEQYPINDPSKHRDISQIMNEDFGICRVLQQQAASNAYRILYTAHDWEEGVDHFDKMVLTALHSTQELA